MTATAATTGITAKCRAPSLEMICRNLDGREEDGAYASLSFAGQFLAIAQIALSLVVLIGAGLFVRTLRNLKSRDLGFEREHILQIWTSPLQAGRNGRVVAPLFETVPQRLSSLPGVISASASLIGLLEGEGDPFGPTEQRRNPSHFAGPGGARSEGLFGLPFRQCAGRSACRTTAGTRQ